MRRSAVPMRREDARTGHAIQKKRSPVRTTVLSIRSKSRPVTFTVHPMRPKSPAG